MASFREIPFLLAVLFLLGISSLHAAPQLGELPAESQNTAVEATLSGSSVDPLAVSTSALPADFIFRDPRYAPAEFTVNLPPAKVPAPASNSTISWVLLTVGLVAAMVLRRRSLHRQPH